jgi:hypothetical protein
MPELIVDFGARRVIVVPLPLPKYQPGKCILNILDLQFCSYHLSHVHVHFRVHFRVHFHVRGPLEGPEDL